MVSQNQLVILRFGRVRYRVRTMFIHHRFHLAQRAATVVPASSFDSAWPVLSPTHQIWTSPRPALPKHATSTYTWP